MNDVIKPKEKDVVQPLLRFGLPATVGLFVMLSLYLIVMLGRYDEAKRQADEAETRATTQRVELAKLQVEVESLTKQRDALSPTVADRSRNRYGR